ncbi:MAG TPA: hypothetical protein VGC54_13155 [Planctomycetota bacterium]
MIAAVLLLALAPAQDAPQPSRAAMVRGAVDWLVANQNPDGSWGSHHSPRPIEVLADVPGSHEAFRYATTGLCVSALHDSPLHTSESMAAAERGLDYLVENWNVKRPSGMEHYSVWAFGYGLRGLAERLIATPKHPRAAEIGAACKSLIAKLGRYQALDGGWGYLSLDEVPTFQPSFTSMSFTTATILVGLERAQRAGIEVPQAMVDRAVAAVARCMTPTGAFTYGELWNKMPVAGINLRKGAACRTPACQEALILHGREFAAADQRRALEDLLVDCARFQELGLRRPIPHESHYQISGYFYLYGHAYAAMLQERLTRRDQLRYAPFFEKALARTRQPDGSFWDYPLYSYHKPYGTAYALIALARLPRDQVVEIEGG